MGCNNCKRWTCRKCFLLIICIQHLLSCCQSFYLHSSSIVPRQQQNSHQWLQWRKGFIPITDASRTTSLVRLEAKKKKKAKFQSDESTWFDDSSAGSGKSGSADNDYNYNDGFHSADASSYADADYTPASSYLANGYDYNNDDDNDDSRGNKATSFFDEHSQPLVWEEGMTSRHGGGGGGGGGSGDGDSGARQIYDGTDDSESFGMDDMELTEATEYTGYNGVPNSMDLPDDFEVMNRPSSYLAGGGSGGLFVRDEDMTDSSVLTSSRNMEDMLMERSMRFYDPRMTRGREKAYLVGVEDRGFGKDGRKILEEDMEPEEMERLMDERRQEREDKFTLEESLSELSELAGTAGLEVVGSTYQRVAEPNPRTYIGTGKVQEVKRACQSLGCCTVVFDEELSPGQQRNLENEFGGPEAGIKVLDRTALILDIFAQHARTREGQLQVELALHMYRLPRLTKLWSHLERQSGAGGVGLRGPGEKQLEVDRRLLKEKIQVLQKVIADVRRHRSLHRRRRAQLGLPVIALVGYTNAGKSTLLNGVTRAGVLAENMLFATLDPTTRRVRLPGLKIHPEVMVTDTVGFIQKLPTNLVAAFRATLEEVREADVIVHVVDISSPSWKKQSSAVLKVLSDMDCSDTPTITLWNKLDLLPPERRREVIVEASSPENKLTVAASSLTGENMESFISTIEQALSLLLYDVQAMVPYSKGELLNMVYSLGACDREEFLDKGTFIEARVPRELLNRLEPYFTAEHKAKAKALYLESLNKVKDKKRKRVSGKEPQQQQSPLPPPPTPEYDEDEWDWAAIAKGRKIVTAEGKVVEV